MLACTFGDCSRVFDYLTAPTNSRTSFIRFCLKYSSIPSMISIVTAGLWKFAVPTDTALAPASIISIASSALAIPPMPMTGSFTA